MTGKIIKGIAGFYYVHDGKSRVYECKAKGVFRSRNIKPLVGDDVEFTVLNEKDGLGNIENVLPRKNELVRPAVANIDQALVIFSAAHPEPNLNLLDRFLVMMEVQRVPVVICFNKADLTGGERLDELGGIYRAAGYPVYVTSTYDNTGMDRVRELICKKTTVLAGPSGVGKSSITNLIQPRAGMETGQISEKIQRGKHTTRHSELFYVEQETYMMDTPGFSSMYINDLKPEQLKEFFPEFAPFEEDCRFLGCVHMGETVCGVKEAVARGDISQSRYDNYKLFYRELKEKRRY